MQRAWIGMLEACLIVLFFKSWILPFPLNECICVEYKEEGEAKNQQPYFCGPHAFASMQRRGRKVIQKINKWVNLYVCVCGEGVYAHT